MRVLPRVLSGEGVLALVGSVLLAMALWPGVWFAGRSMYSTDGALTHEPWRSEAGLAGPYPHNGELGDLDRYIFPQIAYVQRRWHEDGALPTWNPATYAGVPLDANPQVGLYDPFHLLLPWFQAEGEPFSPWRLSLGLTWCGVLRFLLGCVFGYFWLRRLGADAWIAGGLTAFVVAGPYASLWRLHTPEQVAGLVPVALYFLEGIVRRGGVRQLAGFALAYGASNLGGYPQTSLYFGAWFVLYAILRDRAMVWQVVVGCGLSVALAAACWWPFLAYLQEAGVSSLKENEQWWPRDASVGQSVVIGLGAVALLVVARVAGLGSVRRAVLAGGLAAIAFAVAVPAGGDGQHAHWLFASLTGHPVRAVPFVAVEGQPAFIEVNQDHIGMLLALLLLAGAGKSWRRHGWVLVGFALIACEFPLLYQAARSCLRVVSPSRAACVIPMLVAVWIVGCVRDLDEVDDAARARRFARAAYCLLVFGLLGVVFSVWRNTRLHLGYVDLAAAVPVVLLLFARSLPRLTSRVLCLAGALFALSPAWGFQPSLTEREVYPETATVRWLREQTAADPDLRILAVDQGVFDWNTMLVPGLRQAAGVDGQAPRLYVTLLTYLAGSPVRPSWSTSTMPLLGTRAFDLFASRFVACRGGSTLPDHFRIVRASTAFTIAENPNAAPRVYLTPRSFVIGADWQQQLLSRPVQEHVALDAEARPELTGTPMTRGSATLLTRGTDELVVETDADGAAYLVVLDNLLAGWRAELDGEPLPLFRAFGTFRVVAVPKGKHRVRFVYDPVARWGLVLSFASLVAVLALFAFGRTTER